jgi:hypothetical protein
MAFQMGLTFDTTGWIPEGLNRNMIVWNGANDDAIVLYQFDLPPDIPAPLEDVDSLRAKWPTGGSEALLRNVIDLDGIPAVKSIVKQHQQPSGIMYIGTYSVPRESFSYVLKVQCPELGTTGVREAVISQRALMSGQVKLTPDEAIKMTGWRVNPHVTVAEPWMAVNIAEDESLDLEFPDHPLSRLRQHMRQLEPTILVADFVKQAPPFKGPQIKPTQKPWWKRFVS